MYEKLLVPLDGSELAEKALPAAEELASKLGSEIVIVNVRMPSEKPEDPKRRSYLSKIELLTELNIRKSTAQEPGSKARVCSAILGANGPLRHAAEHIVDYAERENVNLIVVATHGRMGIGRWTMGSTANKIARAAKCPVLLIRAHSEKTGPPYLKSLLDLRPPDKV